MYLIRLRFFPKIDVINEYHDHYLSGYLAALYRNGQLLDNYSVVCIDDVFEVSGVVPDQDSLASNYHSKYVTTNEGKLVEQSQNKPKFQLLGPVNDFDDACCCESPSAYVLFTTFIDIEPPVVCVDCSGRVPLYKLPYYGEQEDYSAILSWETTYKACDTLWMESGAGERFGYHQMSDPKSHLSLDGFDICRDLKAKTGKRVYYYLYKHSREYSGRAKIGTCPSCRQSWIELPEWEKLAGRFNLICRECGLVSIW